MPRLACRVAALVLAASLAAPLGVAAEPVFTTVSVDAIAPPRPVKGADGRVHLAYELILVNYTSLITEVDAITAVDAATSATLGEWKGDALKAIFRINGGDKGTSLGASQSALVFLDVSLGADATVPVALSHRVSTTRLMRSPGGDPHKGMPLDPSIALPGSITFATAPLAVDRRPAIRLSPPLKGPGWVAANGCCATISSHRGAVMNFNGKPHVPERFAIDFVQIGTDRRLYAGPVDQLASYRYFDVPVLAAAAGTVVGVVDGMPEGVPGTSAKGVTVDNAAGNHVMVDMGEGNFALYAHLKTGSVAVKPGSQVAAGKRLGQLGNTGNSDAPHLHFHVMDGPSPLIANGLPFVFDRFVGTGRIDPAADFTDGKPVTVDTGWQPGEHRDSLPLDGEVVDFGP